LLVAVGDESFEGHGFCVRVAFNDFRAVFHRPHKGKFMKTWLLIFVLFFTCCFQINAKDFDNQKASFFSLKEIQASGPAYMAPLATIQATDKTPLAFRTYASDHPQAVLIFYHGAGAHSGITYNHLGAGLADGYNISVITPDWRGHGASGGDRGDAPSVAQVWQDISTVILYARQKYNHLPVFLGGHSAGAGLILNYSGYSKKEPVSGYIFVAPYFGYRSKTDYDEKEKKVNFTTVDIAAFIENETSGGLKAGHKKAVTYHFPEDTLKKNPEIVTAITVNMSKACTPASPGLQLSKLRLYGLWIGNNDEAFDPEKIVDFAQVNSSKESDAHIKPVENESHLSILLNAHRLIGPWVMKKIK
jgi:acylglycerol lipase